MTAVYPPAENDPYANTAAQLPAIPAINTPYPTTYGQPYPVSHNLALSTAIAQCVAGGWRVEVVTGANAVLVTGTKPNHVLHAVLTLATCFVWGFVWLLLAATTHESRMTLTVLPDGSVHYSQPHRSR